MTARCTPFDRHDGIRIANFGLAAADLEITVSDPPGTVALLLASGQSYTIAPHSSPGSPSWSFTIENMSRREQTGVLIDQKGYSFDLSLGDGFNQPALFSATLTREVGDIDYETLTVLVEGEDDVPGSTVEVFVRSPGFQTAVPEDPERLSPVQPALALSAWPNPFRSGVTLESELAQPGPVQLMVFDVQGRVVATLEDKTPRAAGVHRVSWNGVDQRGNRVASGIYFARINAAGTSRSARVVLLR